MYDREAMIERIRQSRTAEFEITVAAPSAEHDRLLAAFLAADAIDVDGRLSIVLSIGSPTISSAAIDPCIRRVRLSPVD